MQEKWFSEFFDTAIRVLTLLLLVVIFMVLFKASMTEGDFGWQETLEVIRREDFWKTAFLFFLAASFVLGNFLNCLASIFYLAAQAVEEYVLEPLLERLVENFRKKSKHPKNEDAECSTHEDVPTKS